MLHGNQWDRSAVRIHWGSYLGLGAVILGSGVLHSWFGYVAVGLGLVFEAAGILALFTVAGLILAILLSIAQELWIVGAAVAIWRSAGSSERPRARGGELT